MTKMMRITLETAQKLDELVEISGMNKVTILEKAVEAFLRDQFLKKANEEFAYIKAHPDLWALETEESNEWDVTLTDGLSDE